MLILALPELNPYLPSFPTIFSETRKIAGKETGNVAPKDGRTEEMQNERQDADRFANQLTLRNRIFRNDAQDVPWERTEGAETNRSPERTTYASPVAKALGWSATQSRSPVSGDINEFHSLTGHLRSNIRDDQWHTRSAL